MTVVSGYGVSTTVRLLVSPTQNVFLKLPGTRTLPKLDWAAQQVLQPELRAVAGAVARAPVYEHAQSLHMPTDGPAGGPLFAVACFNGQPAAIYRGVALRTGAKSVRVALWVRGVPGAGYPEVRIEGEHCSVCGVIPCLHRDLAVLTADHASLGAYLEEQILRSPGAARTFRGGRHRVDLARITTPVTLVLDSKERAADQAERRLVLEVAFPGGGTTVLAPKPMRRHLGATVTWKGAQGFARLAKLMEKVAPAP